MKQLRNAIGSLTQLAAVGPQDIHIHYNNAKAFYFENEYKQHTPFGIDIDSIYKFNLQYGSTLQFKIPFQKQCSLSNITLKLVLPVISNEYYYNNNLGYRLIKNIKFKINNEIIESYTGQYLYILHKLETSESHKDGLQTMMNSDNVNEFLNNEGKILYVPLNLWYSRTIKQYFPLFAIYNQNLILEIEFANITDIIQSIDKNLHVNFKIVKNNVKLQLSQASVNESDKFSGELYIDYIYLNRSEQDLYLQSIQKQVYNLVLYQNEIVTSDHVKIDLHFNLPVKQLIFVITDTDDYQFMKISSARLLLGNIEANIMDYNSDVFFSYIQDYYHNLCHPYGKNIYSYSFALNSSISEHNGAVHFGKLSKKILEIKGTLSGKSKVNLHIFARSYNVFHTNDGFGKIEFK